MSSDNTRITITVPNDDLDQALERSSGPTAAVVRSLRVANALDTRIRAGEKLMTRKPDGTYVEIDFV